MEITVQSPTLNESNPIRDESTETRKPSREHSGLPLDLFKLIRKRQWEERISHSLSSNPSSTVKLGDKKLKYISTMRSNPFIDRTVLFNQFTTGVIQAASANILNNNNNTASLDTNGVKKLRPLQNEALISRFLAKQSNASSSTRFNSNSVRFNLNRNEINLIEHEKNNSESSLFRVSSATLANKFDIIIPTALPPIKQSSQDRHYESVFERLNPKYVTRRKRTNLAKTRCASPLEDSSSEALLINKVDPLKIEFNIARTFNSVEQDENHFEQQRQRGRNTKQNKTKSRKSKEKLIDITTHDEVDNIDDIIAAEEKEKQLKLIDDLESGGVVEDIDLTTDDWVNVNPTEIAKRYDMIRRYATAKINYLKNEYTKLETNDKDRIYKLKKQYFEHKKLWETEKLVLLNVKDMEFSWDQERSDFLDKAEVAYQLQVQAQDTAERAIRQLEDFITEDAKLDRENAENTIQILRERSRTLTSLSVGKIDDENEFKTDQESIQHDAHQQKQNSENAEKKLSSDELSEKIQVQVDNFTLKFSNKNALEKIIDYINFESSNKYTLILNYAGSSKSMSRSNTRDKMSNSKSRSPSNRKRSSAKSENLSNTNSGKKTNTSSPERKKSSKHSGDNIDQVAADSSPNNNNNEILDQVLTKVITEDEAMIAELKNTNKNRSSLRSKHLAQLEENKANLNEIKSIATQKLISNSNVDQEFPSNEEEALNRSHSGNPDRIKAASEAILSRVSSSKARTSSASQSNSNLLSHPIFLEYIKSYDNVVNFRNIVLKNLPNESKMGSLSKYYEKLSAISLVEIDKDLKITPQIITMTSTVEGLLTEIGIIFSQIVDELIASKYDTLEKEQQLIQVKQRSPPQTSTGAKPKLMDGEKEGNEMIAEKLKQLEAKNKEIQEKEVKMDEKEKSLVTLEVSLNMQTKTLNEQANVIKLKEEALIKQKKEFEDVQQKELEKKMAESKIQSERKIEAETELAKLKDTYANLEKKFQTDAQNYLKQIDNYKIEIVNMNEVIKQLKRDLTQATKEILAEVAKNSSPKLSSPRSGTMILPPISPKQSEQFKQSLKSQESPNIMFTRLDAVQNIKRLKAAINRGHLNDNELETAKQLMEDYMCLQTKRFVEMVKKYLQYKRLKETQEFLQKNQETEPDVNSAKTLEKMRNYQDKKANRYIDMIKSLKERRISLAYDLTETLSDLERKSGIFLVKPLYSYQGLTPNEQYMKLNKLSRSGAFMNYTAKDISKYNHANQILSNRTIQPIPTPSNTQSITFMPKMSHTNWSVQDSFLPQQSLGKKAVKSASDINLILGTPRILEIDINRMMITQNQIAANIDPSMDGNRYSNNIRSYMAINRASGLIRRDLNQAYTTETPFVSRALGVEHKNQTSSPPLPPINQIARSKSFVSMKDFENGFDTNMDPNDFVELASIEGSESVVTGNLSRANTDLLPQE